MKPLFRVGVAILAFGIAVFLWKAAYRPEPVYNGKTLTQWAEQFGSNNWRAGGRGAAAEAQLAIQQIGTNGVPFLLDLIRAKDSPTKKKLRTLLPPSWHARLSLNDRSGEIRRIGAHGLAAFGTNAPAAVPYLIQIASSHSNDDARYIAAFTIRTMGSAAEPAIPFLIQCLTNRMNTIRDEAALALGYLHLQPEVVVFAFPSGSSRLARCSCAHCFALIHLVNHGWRKPTVRRFAPRLGAFISSIKGETLPGQRAAARKRIQWRMTPLSLITRGLKNLLRTEAHGGMRRHGVPFDALQYAHGLDKSRGNLTHRDFEVD